MPMRKKQINVHKFLRIAKDPLSVKVKGLYAERLHRPDLDIAIEAYIKGDFIYMWRKCNKQTGNKMNTYFARYNLTMGTNGKEYVTSGGRV